MRILSNNGTAFLSAVVFSLLLLFPIHRTFGASFAVSQVSFLPTFSEPCLRRPPSARVGPFFSLQEPAETSSRSGPFFFPLVFSVPSFGPIFSSSWSGTLTFLAPLPSLLPRVRSLRNAEVHLFMVFSTWFFPPPCFLQCRGFLGVPLGGLIFFDFSTFFAVLFPFLAFLVCSPFSTPSAQRIGSACENLFLFGSP